MQKRTPLTLLPFALLVAWGFLFPAAPLRADTTWVNTLTVSGLWEVAHSPYVVPRPIAVPAGQTLEIEAGVRVLMQWATTGAASLTINGRVLAQGVRGDSVYFMLPAGLHIKWGGIKDQSTADSSYFDYTVFQDATQALGGAYSANGTSPTFRHCTFRRNTAASTAVWARGGAFHGMYSSPVMDSCVFITNLAGDGGALRLFGTRGLTPVRISGCVFQGNWATGSGGALMMEGGTNALVAGCTFSGNVSTNFGGAIVLGGYGLFTDCSFTDNLGGYGAVVLGGGTGEFRKCLIRDNECRQPAGSIEVLTGGSARMEQCDIVRNRSFGVNCYIGNALLTRCNISGNSFNGVLTSHNATATLSSSILAFNGGSGIGIGTGSTGNAHYCGFFGNARGAYDGLTPNGAGPLSTVNSNGDSCDVGGNVYLDPQFCTDPRMDPFPELIPDSPYWNAGDPALPYDADSTVADIGSGTGTQNSRTPPPPFSLRAPADSFVVNRLTEGNVAFQWQSFDDPDPCDSTTYTLWLATEDSLYHWDCGRIASSVLYYLLLITLPGTKAEWWVEAHSSRPDSTVSSRERRSLFLVSPFQPPARVLHFTLHANYPNPFNQATRIVFELPDTRDATLEVFDLQGRSAWRRELGKFLPGVYEVPFEPAGLATGIYFYRMATRRYVPFGLATTIREAAYNYSPTGKLILLK